MAKTKERSKTTDTKRRKYRKRKPANISIWYIVGIISIVAGLIIWPYIGGRRMKVTGAKVPPGGYCYGIDISYYQQEIKWDSIRVMTDVRKRTTSSKLHAKDIKPVSFVFIKASEGDEMKDRKFVEHWDNAGAHGIKRGAYHFFRSSKDPLAQVENFIGAVSRLEPDDLPPVLDIETIHRGCSRQELNKKALVWLKKVESHFGKKPIVYSSAHFLRDILCDEIKDNYHIWVAHYDRNCPDFNEWVIWQFTDNAVIYGINGKTDLNATTKATLERL